MPSNEISPFFCIGLRSREKGSRVIFRYPLVDSNEPILKELGSSTDASKLSTPSSEDGSRSVPTGNEQSPTMQNTDSHLSKDPLSPIVSMLFPRTSLSTVTFSICMMGFIFIVHYVSNTKTLSPFIFVLGLRETDFDLYDLNCSEIDQYKQLLQLFAITCTREEMLNGFLSHELSEMSRLSDQCENWNLYLQEALTKYELAQEIKQLMDAVSKQNSDAVELFVNGSIRLSFTLPRINARSRSTIESPALANFGVGSLPWRRLVIDEEFALSSETAVQFISMFPTCNFFEILEFFRASQAVVSYAEHFMKEISEANYKNCVLQWLVDHNVLKLTDVHYLLIPKSVNNNSSTPKKMHPRGSVDFTRGYSHREAGRASLGQSCVFSLNPMLHHSPHGAGGFFVEDDSLHHHPLSITHISRSLDMSEEDLQALVTMCSDRLRDTFLRLLQNNLLDGRHSRTEIIYVHGFAEPKLDAILTALQDFILKIEF